MPLPVTPKSSSACEPGESSAARMAAFASCWPGVNRGGVPYRDGWDTKGPLTYYVLAVSQVLFGANQWGIRLVDFALLLQRCLGLGDLFPVAGRATAAPDDRTRPTRVS